MDINDINELRKGNFILIDYGNGCKDICKIEQINKEERKAILKDLADNANIKIDSQEKWAMLEAISFKKEFLEQLGFKEDDDIVSGLPDTEVYKEFIKGGNDIRVRKEKGKWVLVTQKDGASHGCEFHDIPFLHIFQNLLSDYWHIKICEQLRDYLLKVSVQN